MRRSLPPLLGLLGWVSLAIACGGGGGSDPDAGLSASCLEAADHSDLAWLQENLFTPGCAKISACHTGRALSANELNLEPGNTETSLIGVPHQEFTTEILVVPGSPETSYLMVLLGDRTGPLNAKGTMPLNNPLLCQPKRDAIARWITNLP